MNYFFEVVFPQLIKYFEESGNNKTKELTSLLVIDVLKTDEKYLKLLDTKKLEIKEN